MQTLPGKTERVIVPAIAQGGGCLLAQVRMVGTVLLRVAYTALIPADVLHHATVEHLSFLMVDHRQFCEHRQYLAFFQWLGAGHIGSFVDVPAQTALADQKAAWF